ncbi:hypothetical protein FEM08_20700 [Flavobacterium gilvum]|nr:hypothetical protein FEM08_20700 [Flavobacterium gilvum]
MIIPEIIGIDFRFCYCKNKFYSFARNQKSTIVNLKSKIK